MAPCSVHAKAGKQKPLGRGSGMGLGRDLPAKNGFRPAAPGFAAPWANPWRRKVFTPPGRAAKQRGHGYQAARRHQLFALRGLTLPAERIKPFCRHAQAISRLAAGRQHHVALGIAKQTTSLVRLSPFFLRQGERRRWPANPRPGWPRCPFDGGADFGRRGPLKMMGKNGRLRRSLFRVSYLF